MSNVTQFFPGGSGGGGGGIGDFSRVWYLNPQFENQVLITSNTTFVVPPGTKAIKFTAVGGGQAGVGSTGGPGGGYFEKTYQEPFTGLTTSFQLTIGAAGGNTVLADSAGTTIATAYGATAISASNPVGVGGTASGGDVNSNGSPGGTSPGVGGASGGKFGDGVYDATYAGRWVYFRESLINDNIKNLVSSSYYINTGNSYPIGFNSSGALTAGAAGGGIYNPNTVAGSGGLLANGGPGPVGGPGGWGGDGGPGGKGGDGGFGGVGASSPGTNQPAGNGGFGGNGGNGGPGQGGPAPNGPGLAGGNGGAGGFGSFGGNGGNGGRGGPVPGAPAVRYGPGGVGGAGGPGGFGGGGGVSGRGGPGGPEGAIPLGDGGPGGNGGFGGGGGASNLGTPTADVYFNGGAGGAGAIIVEWTTTALPT